VKSQSVHILDATSLRALAHPLRLDLLERLRRLGPATATQLAAELTETSGATSYHLRQLARHGFVEEDTERGTRRERWWRPVEGGLSFEGFRFRQDPATSDAADFLIREINERRFRRLLQWFARADEWPDEWKASATDSDYRLTLTQVQLASMRDELEAVIHRYEALGDDHDPAARTIEAQLALFPDVELGAPPDGSSS
jgi:DNA-binding transcriptional ArsR family regulator